MDIGEIKKVIYDKIKFVTGEDFPLEKDFGDQLVEIRKHFISVLKKEKYYDGKILLNHLKENYPQAGIDNRDQSIRIFNSFKNRLKGTNPWLEKYYLNEYYRDHFIHLVSSEWEKNTLNDHVFGMLKYYWGTINTALKYLKSENLNDTKKYIVNIWKSKNSGYGGYELKLYVYLISANRIIELIISRDKLLGSTEHIIQRDVKKIEIVNDVKVLIHYHGLHDPDVLIMDNYDDALCLRKEITGLKENKFNYNRK